MNKLGFTLMLLAILFLASLGASKLLSIEIGNKIAIVKIQGAISSDSMKIPFQTSIATSSKIVEYLEAAEKSKAIKGIILEINSPGGTVLASKDIADKVKSIEKPVVALIRDMGTSGGYWVASAADKIVADPMSVTGSIGVISAYLEFSELFEKYGITYEGMKSGELKDIGSPFKKLTDEERKVLQSKLDRIHEYFIKEVSANRKLSEADTRELATGVYFLGEEAKEIGLVDYLGNRELAINITKELAGIDEASIVTYEETTDLLSLLSKLETSGAYYFGKGFAAELRETKLEGIQNIRV